MAQKILDEGIEDKCYDDFMTYGWYDDPKVTNLINLNALSELIYFIKSQLGVNNKDIVFVHDHIKEFENTFQMELRDHGIDMTFADSKQEILLQVADNAVSVLRHAYDKCILHHRNKEQWQEKSEWDILPDVLPSPFVGILLSVVLYAIGSGLIEVLISPIVEACPFENKEGTMSLLHSFYCWGAMGVIIGSTLFFSAFGVESWRILTVIWALVPLYNTVNFISCPIERLVEDGQSMGIKNLLRTPVFWLMILLMVCSGASEATMAQWASAFTESAIGVSKTVGDLAGPCAFAMFMGIARMLYGKFSEKLDLTKVMLLCGILCACCYLLASLSTLPLLGLAGCALCGLAVGIMWPGSISLSSKKCPKGGTAMFAFLALAGDLGAMVSPSMVGTLSEMAGGDLKAGLLVATVFPVVLVFVLLILHKTKLHSGRV